MASFDETFWRDAERSMLMLCIDDIFIWHLVETFWWDIFMGQVNETYWLDMLMRPFDETFLWHILLIHLMTHFDETFWRNILRRHFDEKFLWRIRCDIQIGNFNKPFWWHILWNILIRHTMIYFDFLWWTLMTVEECCWLFMTFDMVMMVIRWPYDSFDCLLFYYKCWRQNPWTAGVEVQSTVKLYCSK